MRWTATSKRWQAIDDRYGLMSILGEPTPACLAKELFAQNVRYGDFIRFPEPSRGDSGIDAIVAWNEDGRRSMVFVNTTPKRRHLDTAEWDNTLGACGKVLKVDVGTRDHVAVQPFDGTVRLEGYGVAVVTNAAVAMEDGEL
jgi:hypothetical protein